MREQVFSQTIHSGKRNYYLTVKKAVNGKLYLDIAETAQNAEGKFDRKNILIFSEDIQYFKQAVDEISENYFKDAIPRQDKPIENKKQIS